MLALATLTQFEDAISNEFDKLECLCFVTSVVEKKMTYQKDPANSN